VKKTLTTSIHEINVTLILILIPRLNLTKTHTITFCKAQTTCEQSTKEE